MAVILHSLVVLIRHTLTAGSWKYLAMVQKRMGSADLTYGDNVENWRAMIKGKFYSTD